MAAAPPKLVNAYVTHAQPPELTFRHRAARHRTHSDPELLPHLHGFAGYVARQGGGEMTAKRYGVIQHILRVRHHFNFEVTDLSQLADWATAANAVLFLTDGSVRDPAGRVLFDPSDGSADASAALPFLPEARARKQRTLEQLAALGVPASKSLPPSVCESEVNLRDASEVALRALALIVVAVRAESLNQGEPLSVAELRERLPGGFRALTPVELEFLEQDAPEQQAIVNHAWRYESLTVLLWALGLLDTLPPATEICDVPKVAGIMFQADDERLMREAKLRATPVLLDALDLHFRLHWAVRQARQDESEPPAELDPGVIMERHHAFNWLTGFHGAEWDDVDTPT